jgi:hypothetical protein
MKLFLPWLLPRGNIVGSRGCGGSFFVGFVSEELLIKPCALFNQVRCDVNGQNIEFEGALLGI